MSVGDDDAVGVNVSVESLSVDEGAVGVYTVRLDSEPAGDVVVTVTDPADNPDVTTEPAALTFSTENWAAAQTVTVSAAQDDDAVDDTATVTHSAASVADSAYDAVAVAAVGVSVGDNDAAVGFGEASYRVDEGSSVTVTVELSQALGEAVVVPLTATAQNGAGTGDYSGVPASVAFAASQTQQSFSLTAADDAVDDDGESVILGFGALPAGVVAGSAAATTVSIGDNDAAGVNVSVESLSVDEGAVGVYTVRLDSEPAGDVVVTVTDPADNPDVTTEPAALTFSTENWAAAQTVTVSAAQDDDAVDDTATVTHSAASVADSAYDAVAVAAVEVSVGDDDAVGVNVSVESLSVDEGAVGVYTVRLDSEPAGDVVVTVTDPADNPDVTTEPAALTFSTENWAAAQTVTVSAAQDDDAVDDTATVTHSAASVADSAYDAVAVAAVGVSVGDNDAAVGFGEASYRVDEGSSVTVTVELSQALGEAVVVPLTATAQNGAGTGDYSGVPASVAFAASQTQQSFSLTAADDAVDDDGESVILGFGALPAGVVAGSATEAEVSIVDDDSSWCSFRARSV